MLPLTEKWVCTISTQYGCSVGCRFCDVPKVGLGVNASFKDMQDQILAVLALHPEVKATKRFNIHFARMGEPTYNMDVIQTAKWADAYMKHSLVHPVVSTMMPANNSFLADFLYRWMCLKNENMSGNAGLQISINSTDDEERNEMFNYKALTLEEIFDMMRHLRPRGRKITLNFAVANYKIDPRILLKYFSTDDYVIKLTPMHVTASAVDAGIKTSGDYTTPEPYMIHEEALKQAGYEVLTFIASEEEDLSRITCGNAILSGTRPLVSYTEQTWG